MDFVVHERDGNARLGLVTTDHGAFETPAFMPVGTQATVKAMLPSQLREIGAQIVLSNTYHLYLRPGTDVLFKAGGLQRFMGWDRPILTDSGGYQIFSLSDLRTLSDDGVEFRSHLDGSKHFFSPESVIDIQRLIGSDIMMVLDECPPYPADREYARRSNELTISWAERCLRRFRGSAEPYGYRQALFGIIQGSTYPDLRQASARSLLGLEFDGYAIGGLAVGEPIDKMYEMISICTALMPGEKPRYLMGVGTPENLIEAIGLGVDMFDCVLPTRNGRNATLFTRHGTMNITNAQYKSDNTPIDAECGCQACRTFTRAYLRHLFNAKEILALQLATIHNLYYYQWLMKQARLAIAEQRFQTWKQEQLTELCRFREVQL